MKRQAVMLVLTLLLGSAYGAFADTTPAMVNPLALTENDLRVPEKFTSQFQRAKDYQIAYAEQGKKASPWLAKFQVVKEKTFLGLLSTTAWSYPPIAKVETAPGAGWFQFKSAALRETPLGWCMELEPRDKKLAGFQKMTVIADQKDITAVEIK